ncbi:MAG TPA: CBO0543 family protein [Bacillota bacterium]|nr:CBO0543 family protein [Bacillota bacterium]
MNAEILIQYGSMIIAVLLLFLKRKGMKRFVPVGLFASFYANIWCFLGMSFNWWTFPSRITNKPDDVSWPVNFVIAPVTAMLWVRYFPLRLREQITWLFLWTSVLTGFEFAVERFTNLLKYHDGYDWYYSYVIWFFSFLIWYGFHLWFYNGRKEFDSVFK